jgi:hypothetical protein
MDRNRIVAWLLLAFAAVYGFAIDDITLDLWAEQEVLNARTLPTILCGGLIALSLALLAIGGGGRVTRPALRPFARLGVMLGFMTGFAVMLELLGFWIAGGAFLVAGLLLMGERRLGWVLGMPAFTMGIAWLLLVVVLDVYLPAGALWMR